MSTHFVAKEGSPKEKDGVTEMKPAPKQALNATTTAQENPEKTTEEKMGLLKIDPALIHPPFHPCNNKKHENHPLWEDYKGLSVILNPETKLPMAIWEPIALQALFFGRGFLKKHKRLENVHSFHHNPDYDPYKEDAEEGKILRN